MHGRVRIVIDAKHRQALDRLEGRIVVLEVELQFANDFEIPQIFADAAMEGWRACRRHCHSRFGPWWQRQQQQHQQQIQQQLLQTASLHEQMAEIRQQMQRQPRRRRRRSRSPRRCSRSPRR